MSAKHDECLLWKYYDNEAESYYYFNPKTKNAEWVTND
jgi:hypothetical protein